MKEKSEIIIDHMNNSYSIKLCQKDWDRVKQIDEEPVDMEVINTFIKETEHFYQ